MKIGNIIHNKGQLAEKLVVNYLTQQNLAIIQTNYRCKGGEIDIIAQQGTLLIFIEVKYRSTASFGTAGESITRTKQKRIILAARHYLMALSPLPNCRFDALLIDNSRITWEKNCFQVN
jgi:putative endonuclease